jgi:hypothetical protein
VIAHCDVVSLSSGLIHTILSPIDLYISYHFLFSFLGFFFIVWQDAAYAQFEQVRLKIPPDKPLAVQQWRGRTSRISPDMMGDGCTYLTGRKFASLHCFSPWTCLHPRFFRCCTVIAVNYPAREFGITRHLPFDEAKKKCPHLICVHVATYAQGDAETEAKYHHNPKPETHKVSTQSLPPPPPPFSSSSSSQADAPRGKWGSLCVGFPGSLSKGIGQDPQDILRKLSHH